MNGLKNKNVDAWIYEKLIGITGNNENAIILI